MLKNILNIFSKNDKTPRHIGYEEAKTILEDSQGSEKSDLARHKDTNPEVLYFLASDENQKIRKSIASNPNTPIQADEILARDEEDEVRQELARKISRIFPEISPDGSSQICEKALKILDQLAEDQVVKVRQIIAEELKSCASIPKSLATKLAKDEDLLVCGPMLEYSPLLSQADLREIIAATTLTGVLKAISKRSLIDEDTSQAIANTQDIPAIASLLTNQNAQIREDTLDAIIDQAEKVEPLHNPLASRPNLSIRALKRIAGFVASSLVYKMIEKHDLENSIADDLLKTVRERIENTPFNQADDVNLAKQAKELFEKGLIDDVFIQNAVKNTQRELIMHCLALLSNIPITSVRKIMASKKGQRVCAVTWRANLSMRTALELQKHIAIIPKDSFLNAKDGIDYPISKSEMDYELAFYDGT